MAQLIASSRKLPGLNYNAPVMIDDLTFQFDEAISSQLRDRFQLIMGSFLSSGPMYGIVDNENPNNALTGSSRPLSVSVNSSNSLTVDVTPGIAVTKSGNIIITTESYVGLPLVAPPASPLANTTYVIYAEYSVIDIQETVTLNRYGQPVARVRNYAPVEQIIKADTLLNYQNISIFTPERLNEIVVLAVISATTATTDLPATDVSLIIDQSNNINTFNRPWFSSVDIEHRSEKGTGSDSVPHNLALGDLSQGNLTVYQQLMTRGKVLSKDFDVPGCPGQITQELISPSRLLTDSTGQITGEIGQKYINLLSYPIRILAARSRNEYDSGVDDGPRNDIAVELIPRSNILLVYENVPDEGFDLYYTAASALEPPTTILSSDIMTFGEPNVLSELYFTEGKGFNDLPSQDLSLSKIGPFPRNYKVFIDDTQQFVMSPQIISCTKLLDNADQQNIPEFTMYGPARISVGLTQISALPSVSPTFTLQLQLNGKDVNGAAISETVTFSVTNYNPIAIPTNCGFSPNGYVDEPQQYVTTTNVFSSLDSWSIVSRINDVPQSAVAMWAELNAPITTNFLEPLSVASFRWNGENVCIHSIRDLRPVVKSLTEEYSGASKYQAHLNTETAIFETTSFLDSSPRRYIGLVSDDFSNPFFMDQLRSNYEKFTKGLISNNIPYPVPDFSTFPDPETGEEVLYTRAIHIPVIAGVTYSHLILSLFYNNLFTQINQKGSTMRVQYRLATTANPFLWTNWSNVTAAVTNAGTRVIAMPVGTYSKIQFRFIGQDIEGFTAILRQS